MSQNSHPVHLRTLPTYRELPRPVVARVESLPPGSQTPWHTHGWWQLAYALKGVLSVETGHESFMAPPQRAILVPPGIQHRAVNVSQVEMRSLYLENVLMHWAPHRCRVISINPLVRELIVASGTFPTDYDIHGPEGRLIHVLVDQLAQMPEVAFNLPIPSDPRLLRICSALQQTPDDSRTLAEWGSEVGISDRSLTRLFMLQTGLSFGDWRQRLRLLVALGSLENGLQVTRVAMDCGYASASAFIAAFRKTFGTTPSQMFKPR